VLAGRALQGVGAQRIELDDGMLDRGQGPFGVSSETLNRTSRMSPALSTAGVRHCVSCAAASRELCTRRTLPLCGVPFSRTDATVTSATSCGSSHIVKDAAPGAAPGPTLRSVTCAGW